MSIERLTAYARIGSEHQKTMQTRLDKIKQVVGSLSDDEYDQLFELAKSNKDEQMIRDLPVWRAMVKKKVK